MPAGYSQDFIKTFKDYLEVKKLKETLTKLNEKIKNSRIGFIGGEKVSSSAEKMKNFFLNLMKESEKLIINFSKVL